MLRSPGEMRACWPATEASEVASSSGWFLLRLMSHGQWAALRTRLAAEVDTLNYQACKRIAQDLQLSYTQARACTPRHGKLRWDDQGGTRIQEALQGV